MIDLSELSVVISGPVLSFSERACASVRQKLPNAEIVFSTWIGEDVSRLDYDKLVQSNDPGANEGNINRQICSRLAGISAAGRKYVLAIRSESVINKLDFLQFMDRFESYDEKYRFVEHRIIIPASYPASRGELFHIGDWYFLGYRDDLLRLWDIPYMNDSLYNKKTDDLLYNPHRYLITAFTRKFYPLHFEEKRDITPENRRIYEAVLANNFVITGFYEYGISSLKYPLSGSFFSQLFHKEVGYTYCEWLELYNMYAGGGGICK